MEELDVAASVADVPNGEAAAGGPNANGEGAGEGAVAAELATNGDEVPPNVETEEAPERKEAAAEGFGIPTCCPPKMPAALAAGKPWVAAVLANAVVLELDELAAPNPALAPKGNPFPNGDEVVVVAPAGAEAAPSSPKDPTPKDDGAEDALEAPKDGAGALPKLNAADEATPVAAVEERIELNECAPLAFVVIGGFPGCSFAGSDFTPTPDAASARASAAAAAFDMRSFAAVTCDMLGIGG